MGIVEVVGGGGGELLAAGKVDGCEPLNDSVPFFVATVSYFAKGQLAKIAFSKK